jgi:CHAD domain-containing protein
MDSLLIKEQKALRNLLFPEVKNYWNQFQDKFQEVQEKARPDAVHDLRVSIRRLRSIILLLKEISLTINIKPSETEMKNLMEIFGRLRDMHIQYDLVKKSVSRKQTFLNPYLSDLNSQILKLEHNLQILLRKARITQTGNLVKKILSQRTFHVIPPKGFDKLIKYNVNHIAARGILQKYLMRCFSLLPLVKNEDNQVVFHKLRINIKKLRYKLEILHPLVLKAHWKKESVVFRSLQNCMGEVHDIDMAFENIRQYFGKHDPKTLKTREYTLWLQKMQRKRGKLFRKSLVRMKNLLNYDFFSK